MWQVRFPTHVRTLQLTLQACQLIASPVIGCQLLIDYKIYNYSDFLNDKFSREYNAILPRTKAF